MWPTPTASDVEGGVAKDVQKNNSSYSRVNKKGVRFGVKLRDAVGYEEDRTWPTPSLNPDWVEWLMGYAPGYTDPEYTEPMHLEDHLGFESEPDIPRVTTRKEHRVNRLKCLGNSIVPQIMYEIGNAILADHQSEHKK